MASQAEGPSSEVFAEMARSLLSQHDVQRTLQRIVDLAVKTIAGCDHAGISFIKGRHTSTPAASDDVSPLVDAIQYETNEGPCLDAIREQEVFRTADLSREERWPNFASRAHLETGVTSMMSFRLFVEGDVMGALNLYSKAPDAFDDDARAVGTVFAAHAAIALSTALHEEQLEEALRSRDIIGQAKGILMAREGITEDEAFDMLKRASQRMNVKLREVANRIAAGTERSASASAPTPGGPGGNGGEAG